MIYDSKPADAGYWKNRKILITGAGGFIGSHLTERLLREGSVVRTFIRYNSANSFGLLESIPEMYRRDIEIHSGDITDEASILPALKDTEVVFHLAAIPSIPYSLLNPRQVFQVNTVGTFNLLLASKAAGVRRVVITSSAGASEKRSLLSPYIMSKAAMEKVGLGFHEGSALQVSTIRLMNNYGPRQSARAIIPTIISQALTRNDVHLGALEPKMDFNFVDDTVEAILRTAENDNAQGRILHWGTGLSISIKELAGLIFNIINNKELHIVTDEKRVRPYAGPAASLEEEISDTHRLLNYSPAVELEAGLKRTISWINSNIEKYKTEIYNI